MQCIECKEDKPEKSFPSRSEVKVNGERSRRKTCRKCTRRKLQNSGKCQCGRPLVTKTLCETCRKRTNKNCRKRASDLKQEVLDNYGKCCVFCKESEPLFLTIDHVEDNGAEHRRQEQITTGSNTYRWLKKNNFPEGFQVTCFNCNAAKARIGEEALRDLLEKKTNLIDTSCV